MNCLILVLLLLCCGNGRGAQNDSGCQNGRPAERGYFGGSGRGCGNDPGPEPRLEPRTFISYPGPGGSNNGCEEPRNNNGCDCGG